MNSNLTKDKSDLAKKLERRHKFSTSSGVPLERVFSPKAGSDYSSDELGIPTSSRSVFDNLLNFLFTLFIQNPL